MKNIEPIDIFVYNLEKLDEQIKLDFSVELNPYQKHYRPADNSNTGVASRTYGGCFFRAPKGNGLFKTYDNPTFDHLKNFRMLNELVVSNLCFGLKIPSATYEPAFLPATNGEIIHGVLSYDIFEGTRKRLVPIISIMKIFDDEMDFDTVEKRLQDRKAQGYALNREKIMTDLFSMTVLDFLTAQSDRGAPNINLEYDPETREYKCAPLLDFELAFFARSLTKYNLKSRAMLTLDDLITDMSMHGRFMCINTIEDSPYTRYLVNAKNIVSYALTHPKCKQKLLHILNNFDIQKAMTTVETQGTIIPKLYKQFVLTATNFNLSFLKNELICQSQSQTSPLDVEEISEYV